MIVNRNCLRFAPIALIKTGTLLGHIRHLSLTVSFSLAFISKNFWQVIRLDFVQLWMDTSLSIFSGGWFDADSEPISLISSPILVSVVQTSYNRALGKPKDYLLLAVEIKQFLFPVKKTMSNMFTSHYKAKCAFFPIWLDPKLTKQCFFFGGGDTLWIVN